MVKRRSPAPAAELLLNLINSVFTVSSIAISSYALCCLVSWEPEAPQQPLHLHNSIHRLLLPLDASNQLSHELPRAWLIYFLVTVAVSLLTLSFFGYVGTTMRNTRYLSFYSMLLVVLFLAQVGALATMFFQPIWEKYLTIQKSLTLQSASHFLKVNWKIIRWLILAVLVLEVIAFVLALYLRSVNNAPQRIVDYQKTVSHDDPILPTAVPLKRSISSTAQPSSGGEEQEQLKQWLSPLLEAKDNRNTRHN